MRAVADPRRSTELSRRNAANVHFFCGLKSLAGMINDANKENENLQTLVG